MTARPSPTIVILSVFVVIFSSAKKISEHFGFGDRDDCGEKDGFDVPWIIQLVDEAGVVHCVGSLVPRSDKIGQSDLVLSSSDCAEILQQHQRLRAMSIDGDNLAIRVHTAPKKSPLALLQLEHDLPAGRVEARIRSICLPQTYSKMLGISCFTCAGGEAKETKLMKKLFSDSCGTTVRRAATTGVEQFTTCRASSGKSSDRFTVLHKEEYPPGAPFFNVQPASTGIVTLSDTDNTVHRRYLLGIYSNGEFHRVAPYLTAVN